LIILAYSPTRSSLQSLPAETLTEIFDYLRFHPEFHLVGHKADLYNVALTCREFSRYAVPLLWQDITLALDDKEAALGYQTPFLKSLTSESSQNFAFTKQLKLLIAKDGDIISKSDECAAIYSTLATILSVYNCCAPYVTNLELHLVPFIPTDCAHDGLWPLLNCSNDIIYQLFGQVANRDLDFKTLQLTVGQGAWSYDVEFRPHLHQILTMLGSKITYLKVSEYPQLLSPRLPTMGRLNEIRIFNVGNPEECDTVGIWGALSPLAIQRVVLVNFRVPRNLCDYVSRSLTILAWNGVDDIVTACVVCYTQLPHLEVCTLNGGRVKSEEAARTVVIPNVASTKLVQVGFLGSFAPKSLIAAIAKRNPGLKNCYAPTNLSDDDLLQLKIHCKKLRVLSMPLGDLDNITPQQRVTARGLAYLPEMRNLWRLILDHTHMSLLDEPLVFNIAKSNRLLTRFTVQIARGESRELDRPSLRAELTGNSDFTRCFMACICQDRTELNNHEWRISLEQIRQDERFRKLHPECLEWG
jgi:hypothetical protein